MNELKPCPFCGGEAKFVELRVVPNEEPRGYCECTGRCCEQSFVTAKSDAIEAWNRRTEDGI